MKRKKNEEHLPWYLRVTNIAIPGAVIGGTVGSIIPFVGTAIGAAAGAFLAAVIGLVFPYVFSGDEDDEQLGQKLSPDQEQEENAPSSWPKKVWFKPSPTKAFTPDTRFFFGASAGAAIGGAIGTIVPVIGTVIGAGIGCLIGGIVGYKYPAIAERFTSFKEMTTIETKKEWRKESTYDSPLYVRLFVGVSAGAILGGAIGSVVPGLGTLIGGAVGGLIGAALAGASPAAFTVVRNLLLKRTEKNAKDINIIELADTEEQKPTPRKWYHESTMDMPWYVRLLAGMGGGAAVGSVVPDLAQP